MLEIFSDEKKENNLVESDFKEIFSVLSMDDEFMKSLLYQTTLKGMQELFKNRGVLLTEKQVDSFIEMVKVSASKVELADDFFGDASAGVLNNTGMYKLIGSAVDKINRSDEDKQIAKSIFWI